ncbi:DUF6134 family protein [Zavarzinella formosa]|uniref:DUF6134 family protein n=1 Tax=Zavarzinella formosa TaxID=360055 RepID=UPI0002D58E4E|nr:DUF6134 family protein [Zavarzinella formosa]
MRAALIGLAWTILLTTSVFAEERTFQVSVDGKPAGICRMKVTSAVGAETVEMNVDVRFRTLGIKYEYLSKCVEVWKNGEVQKFESVVNDDGKKSHVKADVGERGLTVVVDNRASTCAKTAIPVTGWRIPRFDRETQDAIILDSEDGTTTPAKIEYVGRIQLKLANQTLEGNRYKVSGKGIDAEWAYDTTGRPIRQSMKWDGHTVVLELSGIEK